MHTRCAKKLGVGGPTSGQLFLEEHSRVTLGPMALETSSVKVATTAPMPLPRYPPPPIIAVDHDVDVFVRLWHLWQLCHALLLFSDQVSFRFVLPECTAHMGSAQCYLFVVALSLILDAHVHTIRSSGIPQRGTSPSGMPQHLSQQCRFHVRRGITVKRAAPSPPAALP